MRQAVVEMTISLSAKKWKETERRREIERKREREGNKDERK